VLCVCVVVCCVFVVCEVCVYVYCVFVCVVVCVLLKEERCESSWTMGTVQ